MPIFINELAKAHCLKITAKAISPKTRKSISAVTTTTKMFNDVHRRYI